MYPYIEIAGIEFSMTGIGIVFSMLVFLWSVAYLCKKHHKDFLRFFYWMPVFIIIPYFLGSYIQFIIDVGVFPKNIEQVMLLLSPRNYAFHFIGLLLGLVSSFTLFFKSFKRNENKKIWADILFLSFALALIPLGIFLLMWDNFLGNLYEWLISVRALQANSVLNKFDGVYPVGVFLSLASLIAVIIIWILRKKYKTTGIGILGFAVLLLLVNGVLFFQQYPKYIPIAYKGVVFDIKNYLSFFVIMFCLYTYNLRNQKIKK